MKAILDKIPAGASLDEVIRRVNVIVDTLNTVLSEIDEENLSESIIEKIKTGGR